MSVLFTTRRLSAARAARPPLEPPLSGPKRANLHQTYCHTPIQHLASIGVDKSGYGETGLAVFKTFVSIENPTKYTVAFTMSTYIAYQCCGQGERNQTIPDQLITNRLIILFLSGYGFLRHCITSSVLSMLDCKLYSLCIVHTVQFCSYQ